MQIEFTTSPLSTAHSTKASNRVYYAVICKHLWKKICGSVRSTTLVIIETHILCAFLSFSVYNNEGVVELSRTKKVTRLEIPVRRAKGAQGDITVQWSLYQNESSQGPSLLWPSSGEISLIDGEWNASFIVNLDDDKTDAPQSVVWIQLHKTSGGAILGSLDETTAKVLITGKETESKTIWQWIAIGAAIIGAFIVVVLILLLRRRSRKVKSRRLIENFVLHFKTVLRGNLQN